MTNDIELNENNTMTLSHAIILHTHCKCFVCRNRRCLSAIQIQKQTLVNSTDICV